MKKFIISIVMGILVCGQLFAQNSKTPTNLQIEDYFIQFSNQKGETLADMISPLQPTLNDCKVLFTDDYAQTAFEQFNYLFSIMDEQIVILSERLQGATAIDVDRFSSSDIAEEGNGRMRKVSQYFRPNVNCYGIRFLKHEEDTAGVYFLFFTYIDGRWVWFPFN